MSESFESWAIVELMGHVRMAGRVTEEERFGAKQGRVDVPDGGGGWTTVYFGGGSVYRVTPCSEAVARAVAARSRPEPVHPYELPAPDLPPRLDRDEDRELDEIRAGAWEDGGEGDKDDSADLDL